VAIRDFIIDIRNTNSCVTLKYRADNVTTALEKRRRRQSKESSMTTINHTETLRDLTITDGQLVVTKNAGTPEGDPVRVKVLDLNVNLGTNIDVRNGASLAISGGAGVSVATHYEVQNNSTLSLSGSLSVSLLSSVEMQNDHATLRLSDGLAVNLPADISGFRGTDTISLTNVAGSKAVWTQNSADQGTLQIENSSGQTVSTLTLDGHYNTGRFSVTQTATGGTRIRLKPLNTTAAISHDTVGTDTGPSFLAAAAQTGPSTSDLITATQPTAADQGVGGSAAAGFSTAAADPGVGAYASALDNLGSQSSVGAMMAHLVAQH
jgi:hypothetical protein